MIGRVPRRTLSARAARFAKHRLETKPLALGGQLVDNFGNGGQLVGLLVVGARALLSPFKPLHLHFRSQRPAQKKFYVPRWPCVFVFTDLFYNGVKMLCWPTTRTGNRLCTPSRFLGDQVLIFWLALVLSIIWGAKTISRDLPPPCITTF